MIVEVMEPIDDLTQYFNSFFFGKKPTFFHIAIKVTLVAILQNQIVIVGSFLHIV